MFWWLRTLLINSACGKKKLEVQIEKENFAILNYKTAALMHSKHKFPQVSGPHEA